MKNRITGLFFGILVLLFSTFHASATVYYVNASNTAPVSPYATWATAATNIQDAVNLTVDGDEVVVTNGIYQYGGQSTYSARVYAKYDIWLHSVNGPAVTIIQGYQVPGITNGPGSMRCVAMGSGEGGTVAGFTLTGGSSTGNGGGIFTMDSKCVISNCWIIGNASSNSGGGGSNGQYDHCLIRGNVVYGTGYGGGVSGIVSMNNCVITGNSAYEGGGVYLPGSFLQTGFNDCTIVGNYASYTYGGVYFFGTLGVSITNSVIYYNTAAAGSSSTYNLENVTNIINCCTYPTNGLGANNIPTPPGFMNVNGGDLHLAPWSPCIDAGNNAYVFSSVDLDGNPRIVNGTVDIGAYEFQGQYNPTVHYVSLNNKNSASPYTSWVTAATNIQIAIDVASPGDIVLVSNGTYSVGGRAVYGFQTNRVTVDLPITVQGLSGANYTTIAGAANYRCVYMTNGAVLIGLTLSNGFAAFNGGYAPYTNDNGGGVWCESTSAILSNCVVMSSIADNLGGGAYSGTLVNCTVKLSHASNGGGTYNSILLASSISNNTASDYGGGALIGSVTNCLFAGNFAEYGGGSCSNTPYGCIFSSNSASVSGGGVYACAVTNCTFVGNLATNGGGAANSLLLACTLTNNNANYGGAGYSNSLQNCFVLGNNAAVNGGGEAYGSLTSCVLAGNLAMNAYGGGAVDADLTNCLLVGNKASIGSGIVGGVLVNCSISNNTAISYAAALSSVLFDCVVSSNWNGGTYDCIGNRCWIAYNSAFASDGDNLSNCILAFNSGSTAASQSTLNNCTIYHNYVSTEGAVNYCNTTNCIIWYNVLLQYGELWNWSAHGIGNLDTCCTYPMPPGNNNFTNLPMFLDSAFHLASNSPCIDAGNPNVVPGTTDFDGRPRVVGTAIDVGAMEYQGAAVEPFISWLYSYGLPNDGSADYVDSDGTGMNNWQKFIAGLNPTNTASVLAMSSVAATNSPAGVAVTWQSVTNITYYLQRSSDLTTSFSSVQSNLVGQAGTTTYVDASATNVGPYFYRVAVQQ